MSCRVFSIGSFSGGDWCTDKQTESGKIVFLVNDGAKSSKSTQSP